MRSTRFAEARARDWQREAISWGTLGVPADELHRLPRDVAGNVVELRLGTAYFGAWLARRGAPIAPRIVGA
jgi:hypothetical protein